MTAESPALRIGPGIRRRRRALDLTLAEVAALSGLSSPFLSQIENNRARPSMRSLQLIADALETTAVQLLSAADSPRRVDVVRADADPGLDATARVRPLVRGHQQMHALEFTGDHDESREFEHRNDELMYVADGTAEVEAEGRTYQLGRGDTLFLTGGVRHRWRAREEGTRVLLVAVADHVGTGPTPPGPRT
ncbi:XRE family transcriptional regulator [Streptomyces sp. NBC_01020]|uniref:helix-turn-helix domain-containing protein n=1 Tax=unclassified Streptomyces TaxID=2593676 RepID=UPI00225AE93E|nr:MULTISPECIES: XRE family transcriptional regulator [unclassified Streptomyces]MCX4725090.1 XRE family transcriptional regulator [Streptomyces sp. NBC_01306]WSV05491.1 XRE family transcriptional regulator [Streptomyces sp. NBC_01020]WSX43558.1 XRE family transcriptional regulator [Streptomyces sp. NBC_00963]WSX68413.1 XRE family transcriptional regulator [Streptomyces sp. NBC_00932]